MMIVLTAAKMLSRPVARASALRCATRRLPLVQSRAFFPKSLNDSAILEEKYPDPPVFTEAEDPGQVSRKHEDEDEDEDR